MRFAEPLREARLLRRYKRFLADLALPDGGVLTVHCPNTGSMRGCLETGAPAFYSWREDGKRKYAGTLEQTTGASGHRVGVHSARANALFEEALGRLPAFRHWRRVRAEAQYDAGRSRVDFVIERPTPNGRCATVFVEVKSVTLHLGGGLGAFPDSVSERATRHARALAEVVRGGGAAAFVYCIQHNGIDRVTPAAAIDPAYAQAVRDAARAGVEFIAMRTLQRRDGIRLTGMAPVLLDANVTG